MKTTVIAVYSVILLAFVPRVSASPYYFIEINFPGAGETIATGVSNDGLIVGTYGPSIDIRSGVELGRKGFIYNLTNGSYESLEAFGSPATNANSINNNGLVVGDYLSGNRLRGFVYDTDTSQFVDVLPPGVNAEEATISDIDDNGVLIGSYSETTNLSLPDPNALDIKGFRATPDGSGGYVYETFEFPLTTTTFGGSRNTSGVEVGTAIKQNFLGSEVFAYTQPGTERYDFPGNVLASNEAVLQTGFASINEVGVVIGNASIQTGGLNIAFRNQAFLINVDEQGVDEPSMMQIELPCPSCISPFIAEEFRFAEEGRSIATNLNDTGLLVGFNDNNDGIYAGFLGIPVPEGTQPGDFDLDNDVDGSDFLAWQRGESLSPLSGTDLLVWSANFGTPAPLAAGSVTVPEPRSWLLMLLGLFMASYRSSPLVKGRPEHREMAL